MIFRRLPIAAIAVCCSLDVAPAAPNATFAPARPGTSVAPAEASMAAYRLYAKTQADTLVGMTKVLARAIKDGDLDAAQLTYAPTHRYLARIAPIAGAARDLAAAMDASAGVYEKKKADPHFSGFHRIEYGLFAAKSTAGLSDVADRLDTDARDLRDRLARLDVTPNTLLDAAIGNLEGLAAASLSGDGEPYSKTDLWDVEAQVEATRQVVAILPPQLQARTSPAFAKIDALLEAHKDGCGFKPYDSLGRDDRIALKVSIAALAAAVVTLRDEAALD